jgi:hypothetical protein
MVVQRWLMIAALGLLGSVASKADGISPDVHYIIDLEDWDVSQTFDVTPNITVPDDTSACLPVGDVCGDASIRLNSGGGSTPEDGPFSFSSPATGNCGPDNTLACFISDFENTGSPIDTLVISVELNVDQLFPPLNTFECSGGDLFNACGFTLTDPPNSPSGIQLNAYFYNTPEPSQWAVLVLGCAALIAARARQRAR